MSSMTRRQVGEDAKHFATRQGLLENGLPVRIHAVDLQDHA